MKDIIKLENFLDKSNEFYQLQHLHSLNENMILSRKKQRKFGGDLMEHYLYPAMKMISMKKNYSLEDALLFEIGINHDNIEDETEDKIRKEYFHEIEDLKFYMRIMDGIEKKGHKDVIKDLKKSLKVVNSNHVKTRLHNLLNKNILEKMILHHKEVLKNATFGARETFFNDFKERKLEIFEGRERYNKLFFETFFDSIDALTRYNNVDDSYAKYILRIYESNNYVPLIKWMDRTHNQKTMWPKESFFRNQLSLESLTEKESYLRNSYEKNTLAYNREKKRLGNKYQQLLEVKNLNPEWRLKNIGKDIIHLYMGKQFLKTCRNNKNYGMLKKSFVNLLKEVYTQSVRERLFQAVYNPEITIPVIDELEKIFVDYAPEGLNLVDIPYNFSSNGLVKNSLDDHFEGTIASAIKGFMKGEILKRIVIRKSESMPSVKLYENALAYESTCLQNFKKINLAKAVSVDDFRDMRSKYSFESLPLKKVNMNYVLENFSELMNNVKEEV